MVISQGEIWWAEMAKPVGSGPGYRHPVVIVQGDHLNRSQIGTVVCIPLTTNLAWADAPGNVYLSEDETNLPKPSVANASQIVSFDKRLLTRRVGKLSGANLATVLGGIDAILGR